jgi:hypothetical protein
MPDAVITADASTAPATTQAPSAPEPTSFAELMSTCTPEQRAAWDKDGTEPTPAATEAPVAKTETTEEPSASKDETQAVTEPADDDQELPEGDTVEDKRKRGKMFAHFRSKNAALKAENELLRQQAKERQVSKPDSTPAPAATPKADETSGEEFTFRDPTDTETLAQYNAAMLKAHGKWILEQSDKRSQQAKAKETSEQYWARVDTEYKERVSTALKKREGESTEDHRTRTLQYANASRWFDSATQGADFIVDAILESPVGHDMIQYLYGNQDDMAKIMKSGSRDKALYLLGKVEARFESQKTPEAKPITVTRATPPAERVSGGAAPAKDAIAQAEADYERTGDHKYLVLMNKLMDERDAEARRNRRR